MHTKAPRFLLGDGLRRPRAGCRAAAGHRRAAVLRHRGLPRVGHHVRGVSVGGGDIFVAKLDSSGQALWSHGFGDFNTFQAGFRVAAASSGDAILWARPRGALDFGTGPVPAYGFADSVLARLSPE